MEMARLEDWAAQQLENGNRPFIVLLAPNPPCSFTQLDHPHSLIEQLQLLYSIRSIQINSTNSNTDDLINSPLLFSSVCSNIASSLNLQLPLLLPSHARFTRFIPR